MGETGTERNIAINSETVKRLAAEIGGRRQKLDDATMAHADAWKKFDDAGGNKAALKAVLKLQNQDQTKTAEYQHHFDFYADVLGLKSQLDAFDELAANEESIAEAEAARVNGNGHAPVESPDAVPA